MYRAYENNLLLSSVLEPQFASSLNTRHAGPGYDNCLSLLHPRLEVTQSVFCCLCRPQPLKWRICLRTGARGKNEKVVVERPITRGARNLHRFGLNIEAFGRSKYEFKLTGWISIEAIGNRSKELFVGELSRDYASSRGYVPVEMGIWRYESDLERRSLRSLLEKPMCGADSRIGAPENNDVLHSSRFKIGILCLLEVICSEEVKGDVNGLLKSACGQAKNIKHCECRNTDSELKSTI